ncbi:dehydrogenase/reductase SDR family member 11 [Lingula anatina]|uniref:Dehydrogenase/reductase SDR family member 11 n=1 Tax=Lingula anatina TaxID=7574 RepID=A0A1S3H5Z0_LINAN|nr:dehydrogenase/reductase SDR family member 11 [Lingula anatina]|eukprot:XP_013381540.1 dehydrogenase/reductase SDR family member 11 [Lingula anatina]
MERWTGRVALVTGASLGIGAAICRALVKNGMVVVGCARHLDALQKLAKELEEEKGKFIPIKCDLTITDEIDSMFRAIKEEVGGVDVCVNNAGVNLASPLLTGEREDFKTVLDLNVFAVTIVTQLAIKSMRERNVDDGHIINIGSVSCRQVREGTLSHFYAGSKFALQALTEGLRHELRNANTRIRTTIISPSLTDTPLARGLKDHGLPPFTATVSLRAEDVADALIYALGAPPNVNVREICLAGVSAPM